MLRGPSTYGLHFRIVWCTPTFNGKMLPPSSSQSSLPTCYCLSLSLKCTTKHPVLERSSVLRTWGWIFSSSGLLLSVAGLALSDVSRGCCAFNFIPSSPLFWTASPWKRRYYPSKHRELLSLDTTQRHKGLESTGGCQSSENSYIWFLNYDAVQPAK